MKFFHGSPKKLKSLKPQQAKGLNEFQNKKYVFLTKGFTQAALYSISKSLKGKTQFALPPGRLIIVGNFKLSKGYVYEIDLDIRDVEKGNLGEYEFGYSKEINKFKIHDINPNDFKDKIEYARSKEELMKRIKEKKNEKRIQKR